MRLPLRSWSQFLGALGYRTIWRKPRRVHTPYSSKHRELRMEQLEDKRMLDGDGPWADQDLLEAGFQTARAFATAELLTNDVYTAANNPPTIAWEALTLSSGGALSVDGDTVTYTPATGFLGDEVFRYAVTDDNGTSAWTDVTFLVKPTLSVAADASTVGEGANVTYTFTLSHAPTSGGSVVVNWSLEDGSAELGADYARAVWVAPWDEYDEFENFVASHEGYWQETSDLAGELVFGPDETTKTLTVRAADDDLDEDEETFQLLTSITGSYFTVSGSEALTTAIADADPTPTLSASWTNVNEAAGSAVIVFLLSNPSSHTVIASWETQDGTATSVGAEADFTASSGTLTFDPGVTQLTRTVPIHFDLLNETYETFQIVLTAGTEATVDGPATVTIIDDKPKVSINDVTVVEGAAQALFTLSLSRVGQVPITVQWSTHNGSATAGSDYEAASGTATFAAGETQKQIAVTIGNDDNRDEYDENFTVSLESVTNAYVLRPTGYGTIVDNDAAPSLVLYAPASVDERAGTATFVVGLSAPSDKLIQAYWSTASGSAALHEDYADDSWIDAGYDYDEYGNVVGWHEGYWYHEGGLSFPGTEETAYFSVQIDDDALIEGDETFQVTVAPLSNLSSATATANVAIWDDDTPILSIADVDVNEGDPAGGAFLLTLDRAGDQAVTVDWQIAAGGDAENPMDYVLQSWNGSAWADMPDTTGTVTFAAGETEKQIRFRPIDDAADEPDETFQLTFSNVVGARLPDTNAVAVIRDNDEPLNQAPTANDDIQPIPVPYGGSVSIYTGWYGASTGNDTDPDQDYLGIISESNPYTWFTLSGGQTFSWSYTISDGHDHTSSASVILQGVEDSPPPENRPPTANDDVNPIPIPYGGSVPVYTGWYAASTGNDTDPDQDNLGIISESNPYIWVTLSGGQTYSWSYTISDGHDHTSSASVILQGVEDPPPNQAPTANNDVNPIPVPYGGSVSVYTGWYGASTGNDTDPDQDNLGIVSESNPYTWVTLSGNQSYSWIYTISDGHDHTSSASVVLQGVEDPPPDNRPPTANDDVNPIPIPYGGSVPVYTGWYGASTGNDTDPDQDNLGIVSESNPYTWVTLSGNQSYSWSYTISDGHDHTSSAGVILQGVEDPPPPPPQISISDVTVSETTSTATFTLTLSRPVYGSVSVNYQTQANSAAADSDYVSASGTAYFDYGATTTYVTISILEDSVSEPTQTFWLQLSSPSGADIADGSGLGTIVDDEPLPEVSVQGTSVVEGAGQAAVTLQLSQIMEADVTVAWTLLDGTAVFGSDYLGQALGNGSYVTSGSAVIAAGQTQAVVYIDLLNDATAEATEQFTFRLTGAQNAVLASVTDATVEIVDDEQANLSIIGDAVDEYGGGLDFVVSLNAPSAETVTVGWRLVNPTAQFGVDFVGRVWVVEEQGGVDTSHWEDSSALSGTLTFASGETAQAISFRVIDDLTDEFDETFGIELFDPTGAGLPAESSAALGLIRDDDAPPAVTLDKAVAAESAARMPLTFHLSQASGKPVTVTWSTAQDSARAGLDYENAAGSVTFNPGETVQVVSGVAAPLIHQDTVDEIDERFYVLLTAADNARLVPGKTRVTAVITDDDETPQLVISSTTTVTEGGTAHVSVSLFRDGALTYAEKEVRLNYYTVSGTATAGVDFASRVGTLIIAAGQTTAVVDVPVYPNARDDADLRSFVVKFANPVGAPFASGATQVSSTVLIADDDLPPVVSLDAPATVAEGEALTVTVRLSAASDQTVTVDWTTADGTGSHPAVAGGADEFNRDYVAGAGQLVFLPGETEKRLVIQTLDDQWGERDESLRFQVSNLVHATGGGETAITIAANDRPEASIADAEANEPYYDYAATPLSVVLSNPAQYSITLLTTDLGTGTATPITDYTLVTNSVIFAPGETAQSALAITKYDTQTEPTESFFVGLTALNTTDVHVARATAAVLISDPPPEPGFSVSVSDFEVDENNGDGMTVQVTRSESAGIKFTLQAVQQTAAGDDVQILGTSPYEWGTDEPNVKTFNLPFKIQNDTQVEFNETLKVLLRLDSFIPIVLASATGTIKEDDKPTVRISDASDVVRSWDEHWSSGTPESWTQTGLDYEGTIIVPLPGDPEDPTSNGDQPSGPPDDTTAQSSDVSFRVYLDAPSSKEIVVQLSSSDAGNLELEQNIVTFAPGETEKQINARVKTQGAGEFDYHVNITSATNAVTGSAGNVHVNAQKTIDSTGVQTPEQVETGSGPVWTEVTDYDEFGNLYTVGWRQDWYYYQRSWDFTVDTYKENTARPTVSIDSQATVSEGGTVTLAVSISALPETGSVTVNWAAEGITAALSDLGSPTSGTLTFTAGGAATQTIDIPTLADTVSEADEWFRVKLTSTDAVAVDPISYVKIMEPLKVQVENRTVVESAGMVRIPVTLNLTLGDDVLIDYELQDDTATAADPDNPDYYVNDPPQGTLTINAGQRVGYIEVSINNDRIIEGTERFHVVLSNLRFGDWTSTEMWDAGGATNGASVVNGPEGTSISRALNLATANADVTILDDDFPLVEIDSVQVFEAAGEMVFTARIIGDLPTATTSFHWKAVEGVENSNGGAAKFVEDFIAAGGVVTFAPGVREQTFAVQIVDDDLIESPDQFRIEISNQNGIRVKQSLVTGVILNDDSIEPAEDEELNDNPCGQCACQAMCQRGAADRVNAATGTAQTQVSLGATGQMNSAVVHNDPSLASEIDYRNATAAGDLADADRLIAEVNWNDPHAQAAFGGGSGEFDVPALNAIARLAVQHPGLSLEALAQLLPGIYDYTTTTKLVDASDELIAGSSQVVQGQKIVVPDAPGLGNGWSIKEFDRIVVPLNKSPPTNSDGVQLPRQELIYAAGAGVKTIYRLVDQALQPGGTGPSYIAYVSSDGGTVLYDVGADSSLLSGGVQWTRGVPPALPALTAGTRYVLQHKYGVVDSFDEAGNITSREDRNGNATTFAYADGMLSQIVDAFGRAKTFAYTGGLLSSITDQDGRTVEMVYTGANLTEIRDVTRTGGDGAATTPTYQFTYNAVGGITERVDPNGMKSIFTLDGANRVQQIERKDTDGNALAAPVKYGVTAAAVGTGSGGATTPGGRSQQAVKQGNAPAEVKQTDRHGYVVSTTDAAGNTTTIQRNAAGRITDVSTPDQAAGGGTTVHLEYDSHGNVTKQVYADGTFETWTYDAVFDQTLTHVDRTGRRTEQTLDAHGNVLVSRQVGDVTTGDVVITYQYTTTGPLPKGLVTRTAVDVGDGRTAVTAYDYGDVLGTPEFGRITAMSTFYDVGGTISDLQTVVYAYNALGQVVRVTQPDPDGIAGPQLAAVTLYAYDEAGRVTAVTNVVGAEDATSGETDDVVTRTVYDKEGRVVETVDALGRKTVMKYDDGGRLTRQALVIGLVDGVGGNPETDDLVKQFFYDAQGNLKQVLDVDPDGAAGSQLAPDVRYVYDSLQRLQDEIHVVGGLDGDGNSEADDVRLHYTYDVRGRVTSVTDPVGVVTRYFYDDLDRPVRTEYASGTADQATVRYEYAADGDYAVIDPLGNRTEYQLDKLARLDSVQGPSPDGVAAGPVTRYQYDLLGRTTGVVDPLNRSTTTAVNRAGQVTQLTQPDPDGPLGFGGVNQAAPITHYVYDRAGRLSDTFDANNHQTHYTYDQLGRTTAVTRIVGLVDAPENQQTDDVTTTYAYDKLGRLTLVTSADPDGPTVTPGENPRAAIVTGYEYNRLDQVTAVTVGVGTALAATTVYEYDRLGRQTAVTDATDRTVRYEYDQLSRLTKETRIDGLVDDTTNGETNDAATRYEYDQAGRVVKTVDAENRTTEFTYDALGRRTETRAVVGARDAADGSGVQDDLVSRTFYDLVGRVVGTLDAAGRTSFAEYDALGRLTASLDTLGNRTTYEYDLAGRLLSKFDPDVGGGTTETRYEYDALDRLTALVSAYGRPEMQRTEFAYDAVGNRTLLRDADGNETTWHYDALDRIDQETNELSASRSYVYDKLDNLVRSTDRNGRVTEYRYDELGRRSQELWLDGSNVVHSFDYHYDEADRLESIGDTAYNGSGAVVGGSSYAYQYDDFGRMKQSTFQGIGLPEVVLNYGYDKANQRKSLATQVAGVADLRNDYQYDDLGRLTRVTQQGQAAGNAVAEKRVDYTYNAAGQYASIARYADLAGVTGVATTTYERDAQGRLTRLDQTNGGNVIESYQWTYDARNRLTSFSTLDDGLTTYGYDERGQLTTVDRTGIENDEAYTYDANGNRTSGGHIVTAQSDNLLTEDAEFTYGYDAEGNRTAKTRKSGDYAADHQTNYQWDYRNRLTFVSFQDNYGVVTKQIEYRYDVFGNRISKETFDGGGNPLSFEGYAFDDRQAIFDFDAAGNVTRRYLAGQGVDEVLAQENVTGSLAAGTVLWLLADNQGSTRQVVDNTGEIVAADKYDAFGKLTITAGSLVTRFTYNGTDYDPDTGLNWMAARWYDPVAQRWLSKDPIRDRSGQFNYDVYVDNGPTNFTDPTGLEGYEPYRPGDTNYDYLNGGGYPFGGWNPGNWRRWLYTGQFNASDRMYEDCMVGGNKGYQQNKEIVHNGLKALDAVDPTGLSGATEGALTDLEEGKSPAETAVNAAISLAPGAGDLRKAGKTANNADKVRDGIKRIDDFGDAGKNADKIQDGAKQVDRAHDAQQGSSVAGNTAEGFASQPKIAPRDVGASNVNAGSALNAKLRGLQSAQKEAAVVRKLPDGRVRYYGPEIPARTPGPTRGAAFVTEHDPSTGRVRQWMESYNKNGEVVRVHPKTVNGQNVMSPHFPRTAKELLGE